MASIGVLSIFDMNNIGNRLQNFALVEALKNWGHDPVVLENYPYPWREDPEFAADSQRVPVRQLAAVRDGVRFRLWHDTPPWARALPKRLIAGVHRNPAAAMNAVSKADRTQALARFTRRRMQVSAEVYRRPEDLQGLGSRYDAFVVGSDQVWNPHYRLGCPMDLLHFAPPHKRIAYAASVGADSFGDAEPVFRRLLPAMGAVSVRESAAATLVEQTTGRRVPVMPDPTILHDSAFWGRLADDAPPWGVHPYVATYLLYRNGPDVTGPVRDRAEAEGMQCHDVLRPSVPRSAQRAGAEGFLRALRDAEYVVTDSFHATLFSIIFRVPVVVLARDGGQNARIDTLLSLFGLSSADVIGTPAGRPTGPLVDDPDAVLAPVRDGAGSWLQAALAAALSGG